MYCVNCNCDFSCNHAGHYDCRRHIESKLHQNNKASSSKTVPLTSIFSKSAGTNMADSHKYKVICVETRMCRMIAGLNLPLTAAEAITNNVKLMFPDSKIAQGNGHFSFQVILRI